MTVYLVRGIIQANAVLAFLKASGQMRNSDPMFLPTDETEERNILNNDGFVSLGTVDVVLNRPVDWGTIVDLRGIFPAAKPVVPMPTGLLPHGGHGSYSIAGIGTFERFTDGSLGFAPAGGGYHTIPDPGSFAGFLVG